MEWTKATRNTMRKIWTVRFHFDKSNAAISFSHFITAQDTSLQSLQQRTPTKMTMAGVESNFRPIGKFHIVATTAAGLC